jgi:hypothetical protein
MQKILHGNSRHSHKNLRQSYRTQHRSIQTGNLPWAGFPLCPFGFALDDGFVMNASVLVSHTSHKNLRRGEGGAPSAGMVDGRKKRARFRALFTRRNMRNKVAKSLR